MKKLIIGAAVVAAGAAGYWYSQQQSGPNILDYIPADTAMLSVQTKPFPIKNYIDSAGGIYGDEYNQAVLAELQNETDPHAVFITSLLKAYLESMKDGATFVKTFGLPDEARSYFYMQGALPVFRMDIANPQAIWTLLDKAEADSGITHEKRTLRDVEYRAYRLTDETDDAAIDMVVATNAGLLTITFNTSINEPGLLESALGLVPYPQSIAKAKTIEKTIAKYGFKEEGISYIDHQQIVTALVTKDGNLLAKHVQKFFELVNEDPLAEMRSAECKNDLTGIVANWPRTVIGLDALNVTPKAMQMDFRTVLESNNSVIMSALQKMRGFIPNYTANIDQLVTSFGFGFNVNEMVPSLTAIWDDVLQVKYQCAPLAEMQNELSQQSPAMLGMATGMANGVQGMSIAIADFELGEDMNNPSLTSLDALITLSAENPAMLVNMIKPMVPQLANIQVPTDGSAVDLSGVLPIPAQVGVQPKLAVKGKHIVIYSGEKSLAMADKLASEPLTGNGMMLITFDYKKLFTPLLRYAEQYGEELPPEVIQLKDYDGQTSVDIDVTEQGVVVAAGMKMNNNKLN
ncbi:hypothetical protein [Shewanella gelidii]|uniref:Uncharacterized protein n=1 Tax=Shewanella gelidii TaxID=1642821 RepID=A0A917JRV0_9GAMM|nr:hypothetical protein [Shewanella gelidii]MCL1098490.1 hypothetical protein [Shewanella gelidii]GGI82359.1 hypothetical protein GCM10009332_19460 [Shewanella gelidii]